MRVLSVTDVGFLTPAGALYMAYQLGKEAHGRARPEERRLADGLMRSRR